MASPRGTDRVESLLAQLELWVRQGQFRQVRSALKTLRLDRLSRLQRVSVANLARRAGQASMAISILNPVVRGAKGSAGGSEREKVEYAVALSIVGAVEEALEILDRIDPKRTPDALLFRCFALFP